MKACPSCGSNDVKEYEYEEGAIMLCKGCKLQWAEYDARFEKSTDAMVLQEPIRESIHSRYMSPSSIPAASKYPPYVAFFDFLKTKKPERQLRILDIGCGNGMFLQECLRRGYDAIGIEANNNLRTVIPENILNRVIFSPIEKIDTFEQPFDVVTFWDSFEHLSNGFELLDRVRTYLKNDGIIYLRVNNNHDITNFLTLFMLRLFPKAGKRMLKICFGFPDHVWNFSKIGMQNLLTKKNWKTILSCFSETPPSRFTKNIILAGMIRSAYLLNKIVGGGKIGEYYIGISAKD